MFNIEPHLKCNGVMILNCHITFYQWQFPLLKANYYAADVKYLKCNLIINIWKRKEDGLEKKIEWMKDFDVKSR